MYRTAGQQQRSCQASIYSNQASISFHQADSRYARTTACMDLSSPHCYCCCHCCCELLAVSSATSKLREGKIPGCTEEVGSPNLLVLALTSQGLLVVIMTETSQAGIDQCQIAEERVDQYQTRVCICHYLFNGDCVKEAKTCVEPKATAHLALLL